MDKVQKVMGAVVQWASDYPKVASFVAGVIVGMMLMVAL